MAQCQDKRMGVNSEVIQTQRHQTQPCRTEQSIISVHSALPMYITIYQQREQPYYENFTNIISFVMLAFFIRIYYA
jgi:predicted component of type VI protein secretion system